MATESESTPLDYLKGLFRAMRSTHGRRPALKKLGRTLRGWMIAGAIIAALIAIGQSVALSPRAAFRAHATGWLITVAVFTLLPVGWVLAIGALEAIFEYVIGWPVSLGSRLLGRKASARVRLLWKLAWLGFFAYLIAGTAHNMAIDEKAPHPPQAVRPAPAAASPANGKAPEPSFIARHLRDGALVIFGGLLTRTIPDLVTFLAKRGLAGPGRAIPLYGPSGKPLTANDREKD